MQSSTGRFSSHVLLTSVTVVLFLAFYGLGCNGSQPVERLSSPAVVATLAGEVRDFVTGAMIPSALLVLENGTDSYSAMTDGRGVFSFNDVKPGSYRLTAGRSGYVTANESVLLQANQFERRQVDLAPLIGTGTLAGTVLVYSSTGVVLPLANVEVEVPYLDTTVYTDGTGLFTVPNLPAGLNLIIFRRDGYRDLSAYVEIGADETLTRVFEMLDVAGTLSGVVTGAPSGNPVTGAFVSIGPLGLSTVTAADGSYTIARVSSGVWPVRFEAASYDPLEATTTVRAGDPTVLDVQLDYGFGTVRGTVRERSTATPLSNVTISIPQSGLTSSTSAAGTYQFWQEVRTGLFVSVGAARPGYVTSGTFVTVGPGDIVDVDFVLTPNAGDVTGTVRTTGAGIPIVGAVCTIPHLALMSITNGSGVYFFDDVPPGFTPITVSAAGFQTITTSVPAVAGTTTATDIALPTAP